MIFILTTFIFGVHKLGHMLQRKNPIITSTMELHAIEDSEHFRMSQGNFQMAFALRSFDYSKSLSDAFFVKWVARIQKVKDQTPSYSFLPLHKCTEEDLESFNDMDDKTRSQLEMMH